ncbi:unnamed protein product [Pleuronectes platessa]|uniref:Uncharacterized protein n=1 Tax=Pleuronectes platessa TaxID=8262 RepID=A0A9N7V8B5_PLEPL|nr:unnamed protein product [Pleuronectes platessa]
MRWLPPRLSGERKQIHQLILQLKILAWRQRVKRLPPTSKKMRKMTSLFSHLKKLKSRKDKRSQGTAKLIAASGEPLPPLAAHWRRRTPVRRSQRRAIPHPRAASEVAALSRSSIGPSRCQSGSSTLYTVLLSGSLSAETSVILAARGSCDHGRSGDPYHGEERASAALKEQLSSVIIGLVFNWLMWEYSGWYLQVSANLSCFHPTPWSAEGICA